MSAFILFFELANWPCKTDKRKDRERASEPCPRMMLLSLFVRKELPAGLLQSCPRHVVTEVDQEVVAPISNRHVSHPAQQRRAAQISAAQRSETVYIMIIRIITHEHIIPVAYVSCHTILQERWE